MRFAPHAAVGAATLAVALFPGPAAEWLRAAADWFLIRFGTVVLWGATACVALCATLAVGPAGRLRIGGDEAAPEFGTLTWLSMLFAAGMGAGLVFWGAAEPLIHAGSPPPGTKSDPVREALALTQFHWSLHAWSIYAVAALAVAAATAPRAAPMPSAPFARLPRRWRRALDWTALAAVLFGVVASLGQGVFQMGAGAEIITDGVLRDGKGLQAALLILLLAAYGGSAATGLARGIAVLSLVNVGLALALLATVLAMADGVGIARTLGETVVAYAEALPRLSVDLRPEGPARQWTRDWSLTYLLWWVAWTPFVGVFVARISRGRSVRAFLGGVVLVPALGTLLWFSVFGGAALGLQAQGADLGVAGFETAPQATYAVLGGLPFPAVTQAAAFLLVFLFLVTSADSGAYVLGLFSRGGEPGVPERLYWGAVLAGLTGAAVWSEGGQAVTRAFAVTGAIPLCALLLAQAVSLRWSLGGAARTGARADVPQSKRRSKKSGSAPGSSR